MCCDLLSFTVYYYYYYYCKLKVYDSPVLSKSISPSLPTAFAHFLSLSHFGDSHNVSNFHYYCIFCGDRGSSMLAQMVKNPLQCQRPGFDPWIRKILWRREWIPIPLFLPGESLGQRSLVDAKSQTWLND